MSINLMALDDRDSPQWMHAGGAAQAYAYTPFGSTPARSGNSLLPGFNGERLDPVSLTYHLGNGYRAYTPALMRFNTPDAWSPYGAGGLNPYSYCEGDPINRSDPSGHLSGQAWAGIAMGIVGLLGAILSAGMSIAVAGTVEAAFAAASATDVVLGVVGGVADVSSIVTGATSGDDPQVSRVAGWVSCFLGFVGAIGGGISAGRSLSARVQQRIGRIGGEVAHGVEDITELHELNPHNPDGQRNLTLRPEGFSTFEDRDGKRLTIHSHGRAGHIAGASGPINARDLDQILREERAYDYVDELRVFACQSADRLDGEMSVAQALAEYSGLPTEGFHGQVHSKNVMPGPMRSVYRNFTRTKTLPVMSEAMQNAMKEGPYYREIAPKIGNPESNYAELFQPSWKRRRH